MRILVIGTGGESKRRFIELLAEFDELIVVDCKLTSPSSYPRNVRVLLLPSLSCQSVIPAIPELRNYGPYDSITTIFEPCVETVAFVRQQLGVPGLSFEQSLVFRDKLRMYQASPGLGLCMPRAVSLENGNIPEFPPSDSGLWVFKPTRAAGNLGVHIVEKPEHLACQLANAREAAAVYFRSTGYYFEDVSRQWLLCEYVDGIEIEVDLLVSRGEVRFFGLHEKTLVTTYGTRIQEDNALTPSLRLRSEQIGMIRETCNNLARSAYELYFAPANTDYFVLYVEFRLRDDGKLFCLELAHRIGGGWGSLSLQRSVGVDTFELAAGSVLCRIPSRISPRVPPRAIYWQLLYAAAPGTLLAVQGLDSFTPDEILHVESLGYVITVPSTQFVACIMLEGDSPAEVSERARQKLATTNIVVRTREGLIQSGAVPVPLRH